MNKSFFVISIVVFVFCFTCISIIAYNSLNREDTFMENWKPIPKSYVNNAWLALFGFSGTIVTLSFAIEIMNNGVPK